MISAPGLFRKMDPEALFFAFYYQPDTYQQYLAAQVCVHVCVCAEGSVCECVSAALQSFSLVRPRTCVCPHALHCPSMPARGIRVVGSQWDTLSVLVVLTARVPLLALLSRASCFDRS